MVYEFLLRFKFSLRPGNVCNGSVMSRTEWNRYVCRCFQVCGSDCTWKASCFQRYNEETYCANWWGMPGTPIQPLFPQHPLNWLQHVLVWSMSWESSRLNDTFPCTERPVVKIILKPKEDKKPASKETSVFLETSPELILFLIFFNEEKVLFWMQASYS